MQDKIYYIWKSWNRACSIKKKWKYRRICLWKTFKGVENAFGGLDLSEKQLKALVDSIYKDLKENGNKIKSEIIGETVLTHLKGVNEVAYLRFASVYKEFSDASDFQKEFDEFNYGKSEKLS